LSAKDIACDPKLTPVPRSWKTPPWPDPLARSVASGVDTSNSANVSGGSALRKPLAGLVSRSVAAVIGAVRPARSKTKKLRCWKLNDWPVR
jgi:hypothetical protein